MRVLVACEFSGVVRTAFAMKGHTAVSCDILPGAPNGKHIRMDVREHLNEVEAGYYDLIIAHPPCTYLSLAGNKHYAKRPDLYEPAAEFAMMFFDYADKVAVENPIGRLSRIWRKPDQIVQPWMFGDEATKPTCLWLKGLPKLEPTNVVGKGEFHTTKSGKRLPKWYNLPPSAERSSIRSTTLQGFADAVAEQWG